MAKFLAVLILAGTFSTAAFAAEGDCTNLKLTAADALSRVCATDAGLSPEEASGLDQIVVGLNEACDSKTGETLQRGILYKNLDLTDNCEAKAESLATQ